MKIQYHWKIKTTTYYSKNHRYEFRNHLIINKKYFWLHPRFPNKVSNCLSKYKQLVGWLNNESGNSLMTQHQSVVSNAGNMVLNRPVHKNTSNLGIVQKRCTLNQTGGGWLVKMSFKICSYSSPVCKQDQSSAIIAEGGYTQRCVRATQVTQKKLNAIHCTKNEVFH